MTKPRKPTTGSSSRSTSGAPQPPDAGGPSAAESSRPAKPRTRKRAAAKKAEPDAAALAALSPLDIAAALNADRPPAPEGPPLAAIPATPAALVGPSPEPTPSAADDSAAPGAPDGDAESSAWSTLSLAERVRSGEGSADLLVFRVGDELFGAALTAIEEALELPQLSHLPEMPPSMLGVISLRGRMLPAYSPARPLGVSLARADAAALVVRAGERRIALAVDDVDDVLTVELAGLRPPPIVAGEERDAVLLGVAARGDALVSVLDADALVSACLSDQALETV